MSGLAPQVRRRALLAVSLLALGLLCAVATGARQGRVAAAARTERKLPAAFPTFTWKPLGLSGGGGMFAGAVSPIDPDLMMLNCDMSGAYVTTDGGRRWRLIHDEQLRSNTRCRPGFHPTDKNVIYAPDGSSGRLKVTRDQGKTWSLVATVPGGLRGEVHLDPDYPRTILVGANDGAAISYDAGKTWHHCAAVTGAGIGFAFDRRSPARARVIFAATETGVFRSDDGGKTWAEKTHGLPWKEILSFAGGSSPRTGQTVLYVSVTSKLVNGQFAGGVYRSTDRGEHWESAMGAGSNTDTHAYGRWANGPIAQYTHVLTTDAKPLTVYACNTSTGFYPPHNPGLFRSDNGGRTWRQTMYMDPRFQGLYNVQPDYRVANQGRSDQEPALSAGICNADPNRVIYIADDPVWITRNGGKTWEAGHTRLAPGQRPGVGSAWMNNGLAITTTWHYYIDPFQPNRHYIAYTDLCYARSRDGGKTWKWMPEEETSRVPPWQNTCYEMAFDPQIPGKIWGAFSDVHDIPNDNIISGRHQSKGPGGVCLSTDFGASWRPLLHAGLPNKPCTSIVLDPKSPKGARTLYAACFDDGVYKSTDDGKTWVKKSAGLGAPENMRVYRLILHPDGTLFALITAKRENRQYLSEGVGLYRSRDGAESWEKITGSLHARWLKDFAVNPRDSQVLFVGAANTGWGDNGLYRTRDGGRTWQRVAQEGPQHFGAYFDPKRPGWIYMTLTEDAPGPSLWLSRDGGGTWRSIDSFPFANAQRVEFDEHDPNVIYVTTFGASVWRGKMR